MHCKSYSHFFSKKFQHICISLDVNFNKSLTNDVVSFEQLGPDQLTTLKHCRIILWPWPIFHSQMTLSFFCINLSILLCFWIWPSHRTWHTLSPYQGLKHCGIDLLLWPTYDSPLTISCSFNFVMLTGTDRCNTAFRRILVETVDLSKFFHHMEWKSIVDILGLISSLVYFRWSQCTDSDRTEWWDRVFSDSWSGWWQGECCMAAYSIVPTIK